MNRPVRDSVPWLRQTFEAFRQTMILQARSRMVSVLLGLSVLFAGFAWFLAYRVAPKVPGDDLYGIMTYLVIVQVALPMALVYLGLTAIHGDLSDGTAGYVFVRPVHRWSLLLGRWLAVGLLGAALATLACCLLYFALAVTERPWRRNLGPNASAVWAFSRAAWLGCPAYAAVGVLFGAAFRRPLVWAVGFVVGWEVFVSNLPPEAGVRSLTVADPVRRWLLVELDPRPDGLRDLLTGTLEGVDIASLGDPLRALGWFTAIVLAIALWIYSRREYDARPRD